MQVKKILVILFSLVFFLRIQDGVAAEPEDSIAVAIVYDTSGSMGELVPDSSGKKSPKYVIANRALLSVVNRLQEVVSSKTAPCKVWCNLVVFEGSGGREAVKFGEFNHDVLKSWITNFSTPSGATPLGEAIRVAAKPLLSAKSKARHILVLTDGVNTAGAAPSAVISELQTAARRGGGDVSLYFIAFDVAAKVFDPVKKLNAMVVGAANEKELNTQLDFILDEKILLEAEEPAVKTDKNSKTK
ncbi:MAG: vWA domain-containing protein [Verrucomicrobiota bacterium]